MDIISRITKMKTEKLSEIAESAKAGDTSAIVSSANYFQTLERCEQQTENILRTLDRLEQEGAVPVPAPTPHGRPDFTNKRQKGAMRRMAFVDRLRQQGIQIRQVRGVRYHIPPDRTVGIAFASEIRRHRWWLGLPREAYDAFVLICEDENGATTNFIFPRTFYEQYADFLSENNDQLKFNITVRDSLYSLQIPGRPDIDLTEYIGAYGHLQ